MKLYIESRFKGPVFLIAFIALLFLEASTIEVSYARQVPTKAADMLPLDPAIHTGKLDNGLTYMIRRNERPKNRAELRLVVNAGSILEDDNQRGLAHFIEHMAFNGSRHFRKQELVEYLESIGMQFGADINAYTIFDETVFKLQLPTDSSGVIETGIQVLRDWVDGLSFDPEEIDKERGVVIEEWRGRLGAATRIQDKQLSVQLKGSRYAARLPMGTLESLESFRREDLIRFYRDWYRPDLISVIVVGDFDVARMEDLIHKNFDDLQPPAAPRTRKVFHVPANADPRYTIESDPEASRALVSIMHRRDPGAHGTRSAYRNSLARSIYSSMLNQRLNELTQSADPPFIAGASSDNGLGFARTVTSYDLRALVQDGNYGRAIETLLTEAERIRRFGFTEPELDRAKTNILRGMEIAFKERDNTESASYANEYVRHILQGESAPGISYEYQITKEILPEVSLADVNDLAKELMTKANRVISISGPKKDDQPLPSEAEINDIFHRVAENALTPYEDALDTRPLLPLIPEAGSVVHETVEDDSGITRILLSNGIKVVLKPTDFKEDEILVRGSGPGGYSLAEDDSFVSSLLAAQVVSLSGVGAFTPVALGKKLTGKSVAVSPFITDLSQGFSGRSSPDDLETFFQLLYLYATQPRADPELFQSYMTRMHSLLEAQKASPARVFSDTLSAVLSQHHFRARPFTTDVLDEADMNESLNFYRDRFSDFTGFTFYIVGSFTRDKIEPMLTRYLASLPATDKPQSWKDRDIRPPAGIVNRTVFAGIEPKSQVALIFSGETTWSIEKRRKLGLLQGVLDTRLREILREDLGGTYGVSVSISIDDEPYESYSVNISFGCSPDRVEELVGQVFAELDSLQNNPIDELYLNNAKEASERSHQTGLRENGFWLSSLRFYDKHGIPASHVLERPSVYLNSITVKDLLAEAAEIFNNDRYVEVILRPVGDE